MINGVCRLCGEDKPLSYEHVPPRSTYNKKTKYKIISMDDYMAQDDPVNHKFKGKIYQGGIGFYSLCEECNSFLGTNYVKTYKDWVDVGKKILSHGKYSNYKYNVQRIQPLRLIKYILSMFVSVNREDFYSSFPEIIEFIRNPDLKELPEKYQLYTYLNNEGNFRHLPFQVVGNFRNVSQIISCSEITYPPYGFVLTFNDTKQIKFLNNITDFKNLSLDKEMNVEMEMYRLPTYFQVPLDYRSKEEYNKT